MKVIIQGSFLLAAILVASGCNQGQASGYTPEVVKVVTRADVAPGKERALFPMVRGNQWVYDVDITIVQASGRQNRKEELTFRCTNVYTRGKKTYATLEAVMNGQVNERQQWVFEDGVGLFQESVGDPAKPFIPPQPALRFPIKKDNVFRWEGTGWVPEGRVTKSKSESKILGPEEIDTGVGRMEAVTVQNISRWENGVAVQTTWWAPGVGIARYRQEVKVLQKTKEGLQEAVAISVMRLKSQSLRGTE